VSVRRTGGLVRQWARRGTRPHQPADQRYESAYLFGAVCPARGAGAAVRRHRGDATAPRGDLGQHCGRRECRADLRSGRVAHHSKSRHASKHHADLASLTHAGTQSGAEHLAIFARQLAFQPRLRNLRPHPRGDLLEQIHRPARNHQINRNARMGARRSHPMTAGISQNLRGNGFARGALSSVGYDVRVRARRHFGVARIATLSELPEAVCRKRHWSRSLRMISSFASP
jgi:hypothetical protein